MAADDQDKRDQAGDDTEGHMGGKAVRAFEPEGVGKAVRNAGDDVDTEGHMGGKAVRAIEPEGVGKAVRNAGDDDQDVEGHSRKR